MHQSYVVNVFRYEERKNNLQENVLKIQSLCLSNGGQSSNELTWLKHPGRTTVCKLNNILVLYWTVRNISRNKLSKTYSEGKEGSCIFIPILNWSVCTRFFFQCETFWLLHKDICIHHLLLTVDVFLYFLW